MDLVIFFLLLHLLNQKFLFCSQWMAKHKYTLQKPPEWILKENELLFMKGYTMCVCIAYRTLLTVHICRSCCCSKEEVLCIVCKHSYFAFICKHPLEPVTFVCMKWHQYLVQFKGQTKTWWTCLSFAVALSFSRSPVSRSLACLFACSHFHCLVRLLFIFTRTYLTE